MTSHIQYLNSLTLENLIDDAEFFGEGYEAEDGRIVRIETDFEPVNVIKAEDIADFIISNLGESQKLILSSAYGRFGK